MAAVTHEDPDKFTVKEILTRFVLPRLDNLSEKIEPLERRVSALEDDKASEQRGRADRDKLYTRVLMAIGSAGAIVTVFGVLLPHIH